jgi:hypothetical protein
VNVKVGDGGSWEKERLRGGVDGVGGLTDNESDDHRLPIAPSTRKRRHGTTTKNRGSESSDASQSEDESDDHEGPMLSLRAKARAKNRNSDASQTEGESDGEESSVRSRIEGMAAVERRRATPAMPNRAVLAGPRHPPSVSMKGGTATVQSSKAYPRMAVPAVFGHRTLPTGVNAPPSRTMPGCSGPRGGGAASGKAKQLSAAPSPPTPRSVPHIAQRPATVPTARQALGPTLGRGRASGSGREKIVIDLTGDD